jgi:hypothetical protein
MYKRDEKWREEIKEDQRSVAVAKLTRAWCGGGEYRHDSSGMFIYLCSINMDFLHHCASEMSLSARRERAMSHETRVVR